MLQVRDKTGRIISMSRERYQHICKHPELRNRLEDVQSALTNPLKISQYGLDAQVRYYYTYHKHHRSHAKYLRVVVKYLNGTGFIITAYFVERIP